MKRREKTRAHAAWGKGKPDIRSSLLHALQAMNEASFTTEVLVPLFKTLKYEQVIYNGGPDEGGKDLVLWGRDQFDEVELAVAQVKMFKPGRVAADGHNLAGIVTQLAQAALNRVNNANGIHYLPRRTFLITPYEIDTRSIQSHFDRISELRDKGVSIFDGAKLVSLLLKHARHIVRGLVGEELDLRSAIDATLNNDALLHALETEGGRKIEEFYTDLDFSVGNASVSAFLTATFDPRRHQVPVTDNEWRELVRLWGLARRHLGVRLGFEDKAEIERIFKPANDAWEKRERNRAKIAARLPALRELIEDGFHNLTVRRSAITNKRVSAALDELYTLISQIVEVAVPNHDGAISRPQERSEQEKALSYSARLRVTGSRIEEALKQLYKSRRPVAMAEQELILQHWCSRRGELTQLCKVILLQCRQVVRLAKNEFELSRETAPCRKITINAKALMRALLSGREQILAGIAKLNTNRIGRVAEAGIFKRIASLLSTAGELIGNPIVARALAPTEIRQAANLPEYRLKIAIHRLFDTGVNLFVLGEAGAGKTTSLQMYAKDRGRRIHTLPLFIPLSRIQKYCDNSSRLPSVTPYGQLLNAVAQYLTVQGTLQSAETLAHLFETKEVICLFDGVDEVVRNLPWIVDGIQEIAVRHPQVQIIASSRFAGEYLKQWKGVSVSLMPFTPTQRNEFIHAWFKARPVHGGAASVIRHLEKTDELGQIVGNPLLATVMCVLRESGVALPDTEVQLYEERMRLLLGEYDTHKGTSRILSRRRDLLYVASSIAYLLHRDNRREASKVELHFLLMENIGKRVSRKVVLRAVEELVDPCNILVSMPGEAALGFGHLRYQEYLAARFIESNRIPLYELTGQLWWRGVFMLLSKMANDVDWIVRELCLAGKTAVERYAPVLFESRPTSEHSLLRERLGEYRRSPDFGSAV